MKNTTPNTSKNEDQKPAQAPRAVSLGLGRVKTAIKGGAEFSAT